MKFTKMQGAGNDFIVIDNRDGALSQSQYSKLAENLCRRRISVGADGMMIAEEPEGRGNIKLQYFNGDGTAGELCGNGARCMAKYAYDRGLAPEKMTIETAGGTVQGWRLAEEEYRIRLTPVTVSPYELTVLAQGQQWKCRYLEFGSPGLPHLIVEFPGLKRKVNGELYVLGKALRCHPSLNKGANVTFYQNLEGGSYYLRTFERGVEDFTYACGSGAAAVGACIARDGQEKSRFFQMTSKGGVLQVEVCRTGSGEQEIYLTGPAVQVYEGSI